MYQGDLVWEPVRGRVFSKVRVLQPFGFFDSYGAFWGVTHPFESDGASFPGWLRWVPSLIAALVMWATAIDGLAALMLASLLHTFVGWPLHGSYLEAAVLHDAAYAEGARTRARADWMFYEALRESARLLFDEGQYFGSAVLVVRAPVMYLGVRAGGWWPWLRHARRRAREGNE